MSGSLTNKAFSARKLSVDMPRVIGMELLDERPVWSMSGAEMLAALDQLQADLTRRQVRRLELLAALDANGHAKDIGAGDTVRLLSVRHRLDPRDVRRDLRLATALPKYPTVSAALTNGTNSVTDVPQPPTDVPLNPAQAQAIVAALEKVPVTAMVPIEDLRVAEEQMVKAARFLSSGELRKLGVEVRKRLDTDGPEPTDDQAREREDLWLKKADHGVTFGGYLAGENAELLQTLIFAGAKPHKTPDGHRDPRLRGKRQADALTAILHNAAGTGTAVPGHGDIKPHITVTIDLDDLRSGIGDRRPDPRRHPARIRRTPPGLRRRRHPPRPRLELRTPRRRHRTPLRHQGPPPRPERPRQRLHHLRRTPSHVRSPPHRPLGRRRHHLPRQPHPPLQTRPHRRPQIPLAHPRNQRPPPSHPPHLGHPNPTTPPITPTATTHQPPNQTHHPATPGVTPARPNPSPPSTPPPTHTAKAPPTRSRPT